MSKEIEIKKDKLLDFEIKKARGYSRCSNCLSNKEVKEVWLGGLLVVRTLCTECLKNLGDTLIKVNVER